MPAEWTLDELAARVSDALGAADYPGAPNGRVREVPDRRVIRWYTTIGLLDRPAGMRGRTALYGPRHLAQLVAIKRRQAQGRSLAEIQAELVGATDETLMHLAGIEESLLESEESETPVRKAFWAQRSTAPAPATVHESQPQTLTGVPLEGGAVLLLPASPDPDDVEALRAAAAPLIDLLTARGLLAGSIRPRGSSR
jgi:DNA-binding transcriptional MerR regulator